MLQVYCQDVSGTFSLVSPNDQISVGIPCYLEIYYQFGTFDGKTSASEVHSHCVRTIFHHIPQLYLITFNPVILIFTALFVNYTVFDKALNYLWTDD